MSIAPPGGRAAVDEDPHSGIVVMNGDFGETATTPPPRLYFRVQADPNTLTPVVQLPCAGAASLEAWSHNIAPGGKVEVSAGGSPGCVRFEFTFDATTHDAWAYPQLTFNATTAPPATMDGIRYTIQAVGFSPDAHVTEMATIFFDSNGTQYVAGTGAKAPDPDPQQITVLLRDAAWGGNGPPPLEPLNAGVVSQLALGLNLDRASSQGFLTVCDLRWVRF